MMKKQNRRIRITALVLSAVCLCNNFSELHAEEDGAWTEDTGEQPQAQVSYAAVNPYYGGWSNCTWSAWQLCYDYTGIALPRLGNAGAWYGNAPAYGYSVGTAPAPMSVGVWSNHVVFVTEVSEDGSMVYIKEGGYCGGYHEGWIPSQSNRNGQIFYGYIYVGSGGVVIPPTAVMTTTVTYDETTGTMVETQTYSDPSRIEFPEVNETVVRVDDAGKEVQVKREDEDARERLRMEDKEQREASTAITTKLLCE